MRTQDAAPLEVKDEREAGYLPLFQKHASQSYVIRVGKDRGDEALRSSDPVLRWWLHLVRGR